HGSRRVPVRKSFPLLVHSTRLTFRGVEGGSARPGPAFRATDRASKRAERYTTARFSHQTCLRVSVLRSSRVRHRTLTWGAQSIHGNANSRAAPPRSRARWDGTRVAALTVGKGAEIMRKLYVSLSVAAVLAITPA